MKERLEELRIEIERICEEINNPESDKDSLANKLEQACLEYTRLRKRYG